MNLNFHTSKTPFLVFCRSFRRWGGGGGFIISFCSFIPPFFSYVKANGISVKDTDFGDGRKIQYLTLT
jgi:hypothetical protein